MSTFTTCLCGQWKSWTVGGRYTAGGAVYTLLGTGTKNGKTILELKPSRGQTKKLATDDPALNSFVRL